MTSETLLIKPTAFPKVSDLKVSYPWSLHLTPLELLTQLLDLALTSVRSSGGSQTDHNLLLQQSPDTNVLFQIKPNKPKIQRKRRMTFQNAFQTTISRTSVPFCETNCHIDKVWGWKPTGYHVQPSLWQAQRWDEYNSLLKCYKVRCNMLVLRVS